MGTADFPGDLLTSQTGEFNAKDFDTQETILEFVSFLIDAIVAAMPLLWVVPVLVAWFCPGPDAPLAALSCVLAATVLIFLQSWLSAAMLVCNLVGAALAEWRCPFFQKLFCAATLVCNVVGAALAQRQCPFFQELFCAAMLVCNLVGAALAQRQCPFFQEYCAATLDCMDGGLCVLPEVFDFIVISMSCMPEVFDFIVISMSCVMVPDRVLVMLGLFVVSMDFQMVKDGVCMFFDFYVVPMDFEMVQDEAAAASKHIECKFHSSRSISNFFS